MQADVRHQSRMAHQDDRRFTRIRQLHERGDIGVEPADQCGLGQHLGGSIAQIVAGQFQPRIAQDVPAILPREIEPPDQIAVHVEVHQMNPRNIGMRSSVQRSPVLVELSVGARASNDAPSSEKLNEGISKPIGPNIGAVSWSDRNAQ